MSAPATKPRLLDLFCGGGGAAMGYHRAGFDVTGVDHKPQPDYPFRLWQLDVFDIEPWVLAAFDAVHAAPLWYRWTQGARGQGTADNHADDVTAALAMVEASGLPFVLELGTLSPQAGVTLCGVSLGLKVTRHMRFTTNWPLMVPPCSHRQGGAADGEYVAFRGSYHGGNHRRTPHRRKAWRDAAGLGWMSSGQADLASPPVYTELIGAQLMDHLHWLARPGGGVQADT